MPDDGVLDQPEWEAFERSAPPPPDGGEWLWAVPSKTRLETVQDHGPDGDYRRCVRVYRQTTRGNWLRFERTEEVVRAAYNGDSVAEAARTAMMQANQANQPRR
jgi:hypothetical protein